MIHKIDDAIKNLAMDVDLLTPLERNPRSGDVEAIKASYNQFGQLKPIVAVKEADGTHTVIAGNHQLRAAKELGWSEIAVSVVALDSEEALAFALADNKIAELGSSDSELLFDLISEVSGSDLLDEELFNSLGWDDFALASMENDVIYKDIDEADKDMGRTGWIAPEIVVTNPILDKEDDQEEGPLPVSSGPTINPKVDTETIVTQGSTATKVGGGESAAIQFTLVFSTAEEQAKWYSFLRWLKNDPAFVGETTTERLLDFIDSHSEA
tara:strand:+ start:22443 stop:23246 length:804 start_codon:yes stop_codon:yes gene_type:complete